MAPPRRRSRLKLRVDRPADLPRGSEHPSNPCSTPARCCLKSWFKCQTLGSGSPQSDAGSMSAVLQIADLEAMVRTRAMGRSRRRATAERRHRRTSPDGRDRQFAAAPGSRRSTPGPLSAKVSFRRRRRIHTVGHQRALPTVRFRRLDVALAFRCPAHLGRPLLAADPSSLRHGARWSAPRRHLGRAGGRQLWESH
jgi:hypothetical protein